MSTSVAPQPTEQPEARSPSAAVAIERCANCGAPVERQFCPECGQRGGDLRPTMATVLQDFSRYLLRVDGKFLRTVRGLFVPGKLTREYLDGRRETYERPFRLFVVIHAVYFVLLGSLPATGFDSGMGIAIHEGLGGWVHARDEVAAERASRGEPPLPESNPTKLARRIAALPTEQVQGELRATYLRFGPKLIFVLLPVAAAALWVVYRKRGFRFAEHFVFCMHWSAFSTLVAVPGELLGGQGVEKWGQAVLAIGFAYQVLALRRVYGGRWRSVAWAAIVVWCFRFGSALALVAAMTWYAISRLLG